MHMASGRELLAVTDAALQSLLAGGGASGSQEGLEKGPDIFSPLINFDECQQSGNSSLSVASHEAPTETISATELTQSPEDPTASALTREGKNHTSAASSVEAMEQANKTLSPLTISAQDINASSMDFTEFTATLHMSEDSTCSTPLLSKAEKENLPSGMPESGKTTPVGSATCMSLPIRVRVSAKKLREIQSPYCSSGGSNAGSIFGSPSSINAPEGGIPRALSRSRVPKEGGWRNLSVEQLKPPQKSLQQGVLHKMASHEDLSTPDESLIVSATASKVTTKEVKEKLLARQARSGEVPFKARAVIVPKMVRPAGTPAPASRRCDRGMRAAGDGMPPTDTQPEKPLHSRNVTLGGHLRKELIQLPGDNGLKFNLSPSLGIPLPGSGLVSSPSSSPSELTHTAKLVATCATAAAKAAATATAEALREKPRETGNTQTGGAQVHESLLTAPKTNTIPLATRGESNQHKYSPPANGDELAGDNTAELARKDRGGGVKEGRLWEHLPRSPNDSCSESDSWASEDGRVPAGKSGSRQTGSSHGRKKRKAYENKHRTKPYYRDAQTGKQFVPGAGRDGPAAARKLVDDKLRSNFDQAYSIDVLTRLQRLEELQHWNTVETFEKQCRSKKGAVHKNAEFTNTAHTTCQSDNTLSSRLPLPSPPSRLTAAQPLLMLDHTTSHKQAAELCSTGQLEPLKEEQKEWPSQAAVISQESAERLNDRCPQQHTGNNKKGLVDNTPGPMQQQPASAARETAHKHVAGTPDKPPMARGRQVISRAERVLSEVQLARDRLELQCALQEAEAQLVDLEKYSHSLREPENGLPSSSEVRMRVGEIISSLEREKAKSTETNIRSEGIQWGIPQRAPALGAGGGRQPKEALRRKPLASPLTTQSRERHLSKVSLKKPASGKQARGTAGKRKHVEGGKGGTQLSRKTEPKAITKAPDIPGHHFDTALQSRPGIPPAVSPQGQRRHPLLPPVPPPSLPLLHSGITPVPPACLASDAPSHQPSHPSGHPPAAMPPSVVVSLAHPSTHHPQTTISGRLSASQGSNQPATVPPGPPPYPVAIPLGAPQISPSYETPYCVHVEEKAVETEGIPSENPPPPKVSDACMQTRDVLVLEATPKHTPAMDLQLAMESLPGVDISGGTPSREAEESGATSEDTRCSAGTPDDLVVSVEGHAPSPPHHGLPFPPPPHLPSHPSTEEGREGERLTSDELDQRLRDNMQTRAMEWVQQELLARVLAQTDSTPDQVPPLPDHTPNSCSTCTTPPDPQDLALAPVLGEAGLQVFVDCGVPVDRRVVLQMVREAVLQQAAVMTRGSIDTSEAEEESQDFSYTPPESEGVRSSSPSESATPLLSTPHPSPPPSLSHEHTLTADESVSELAPPLLLPEVTTPTTTPPPSPKSGSLEELLHESISTPQATEDEQEVSLATDTVSQTREVTPTLSHTHQSLPTPSATPISEPRSPESLPQEVTPIHTHTQEPSLSTSPSSSSSAPGHSHSLSQATSSAATDREISMGEYILHRPPFQLPANASLSEGEVPLSPGDARWYALCASKVGARPGVARTERKRKSKPDDAITAFLDLKNTPDPSSDSSQFSDSLQSDSKGRSEGEIRRTTKPAVGNDPFEKFLTKLNISDPNDSSTPTVQTLSHLEEDNTLSEMPSIGAEEKGLPEVTPLNAANERQPRRKAPYHQLYPIQKPGHYSPGETHHKQTAARSLRSSHRGRDGGDLSVSYSEGEVRSLRKCRVASCKSGGRLLEEWKKSRGVAAPMPVINAAPSPGEFHFPHETRDGIDVIDLSRQSSFRTDRRTAKTEAKHVGSIEDGSILDPSQNKGNLRVIDSAPVVRMQPPQLLTVESINVESVATQITVSEKPSQPMHTASYVSAVHQNSSTSDSITEIPVLPSTSSHLQPKQLSTGASLKERTTAANKATERETAASRLQSVVIRPSAMGQPVTVPTGLVGDEPSASAASVTYSSDFDFSSLSVPGLD